MARKREEKELHCCFCGRKAALYPDIKFVQPDSDKDILICEDCFSAIARTLYAEGQLGTEDQSGRKQPPEELQPLDLSIDGFEPMTFEEDLADVDAMEEAGLFEPECYTLDEADREYLSLPSEPHLARPDEIKAYLDTYIIGQDRAKEILSVAAYNHYKLLRYADRSQGGDIEISKSNLILCGSSGVGKTATVKRLAEFLDVPVAVCDCTGLSKTGYVGQDPLSVITELLEKCDNDVEQGERGIIYLDEFDKLAKSRDTVNQDISGKGVQQELLKLIEGTEIQVHIGGSSPTSGGEVIRMDTSHILFICGGAFDGILPIIQERLQKKAFPQGERVIGFSPVRAKKAGPPRGTIGEVTTEDFISYGIIPEILGRLPVICPMEELTEKDLVRILTEPRNAIVRQYEALFEMDQAKLTFRPGALKAIAAEAVQRKTGARGLRSIIERILTPAMYKIPSLGQPAEVVVTAARVKVVPSNVENC